MRDLVSRERIPSTQDTGRGRLKSVTDAIRFTRRTSTSSKTTKVASGEFSYNDMLIVSETIRLQGCACLHWRVRAFGSSGARAFVCSCVRVLVRSCARPFICPCFLPFSLLFPSISNILTSAYFVFDFFFRQNGKHTATFATHPPLKKALLIVAVSAQGFITLIVLLSEGIFQGMGQLKL